MHTVSVYYRGRNNKGALVAAKYLGEYQLADLPTKGISLLLPGPVCGAEKPVWAEVQQVALPVKGVRPNPAILAYERPGTELEILLQGSD